MAAPNGTVEQPIEISTIPPVVGINFGNSYASIAVFTKEGLAECIANEDGERQIACAVSFHGEEMYIGNPAKQQLVKNSKNTIAGFRNLLGKKFSEIPQASQSTASAPVIQHPDIPDEPAYKVDILQPTPTPLKPSTPAASNFSTPNIATPVSEPIPGERILTVSEVATIFLKSLIQSAEDFLGKKVQGAVITSPPSFTDAQRAALAKAAEDAGITVLQLLEEAGAVAVTTGSDLWSSGGLNPDRTQLIVDVGASSLFLGLVSIREGLAHIIASHNSDSVGADQIDDALVKFFASEFTKKVKTPLTVCSPGGNAQDKRAEAKLRLAAEHTKRTLSASTSAACSVESLKDGLDFSGTINRLRFDLLAKPVYEAVAKAAAALLKDTGVDPLHVDEIVYVGGTTALPGLDAHLLSSVGFDEDVSTPFSVGTLVGGGVGDPTTILSRGCAVQAALVSSIPEDEAELRAAFAAGEEVKAAAKTVGLLFPDSSESELGGTWVPMVQKETPLPARRTVNLDITLSEDSKRFAFEVWEASEGVRIEKVKPPKFELSDDEGEPEEEEEVEEVEERHKQVTKDTLLRGAEGEAKLGLQTKGSGPEKGKWFTTVEAQVIFKADGALEVSLKEIGKDGAVVSLSVPAS